METTEPFLTPQTEAARLAKMLRERIDEAGRFHWPGALGGWKHIQDGDIWLAECDAIATALERADRLAGALRWWLCDEHKTERRAMGDHCLDQDCQYARIAFGGGAGDG